MLEVGSVLKSLLLAFLITLLLQTKFENRTLEARINDLAKQSTLTQYTQEVAAGAVVVLQGTALQIKNFISEKVGHGGSTQKASRFNFNFERSEKYQSTQESEN